MTPKERFKCEVGDIVSFLGMIVAVGFWGLFLCFVIAAGAAGMIRLARATEIPWLPWALFAALVVFATRPIWKK